MQRRTSRFTLNFISISLLVLFVSGGIILSVPPGPTDACILYEVQDTGQSDSTVFRVDILDPVSGAVIDVINNLGACADCDIEAIALDPATGKLYGFAGGDNGRAVFPVAGDFFEIDKTTGALTFIGNTGTGANGKEIVAASFRPPYTSPGTLWAFQQDVGLLTINVGTGARTLMFGVSGETDQFGNPLGKNWEGLAWDLDGDFLYGTHATRLYRFDPSGPSVDLICSNLGGSGDQVEALEFHPDGTLSGALNEVAVNRIFDITWVMPFAPDACSTIDRGAGLVPIPVSDIEALAWEACPAVACGDSFVDTNLGETCDPPGSSVFVGTREEICRDNCTYCGDGEMNNGEICDDGNNIPGDGCENDCTPTVLNCDLTVSKSAVPDHITPGPNPDCKSQGKPLALGFRYTGGGCAASNNTQDPGKATCSGSLDPGLPATLTSDNVAGTPNPVDPGEIITFTGKKDSKFEAQSDFTLSNAGGSEVQSIHTSCSQPLAVGDVFGSLTLVEFNGATGGTSDVEYSYEVTNLGSDLTGVTVIDDILGLIAGPMDFASGASMIFTKIATVLVTTTNVVDVEGTRADGVVCMASDDITVTVDEPPVACTGDTKVQAVTLKYTAEGCAGSDNDQPPDKASCTGDVFGGSPVTIDLADTKGALVLDKTSVSTNEEFTISSTDVFDAETTVRLTGNLGAETNTFHTSCSQPLAVDDQFGSLLLTDLKLQKKDTK